VHYDCRVINPKKGANVTCPFTGLGYDAVDRKLYINSRIGDNFRCFFSTETGFGNIGRKNGKPFMEMKSG